MANGKPTGTSRRIRLLNRFPRCLQSWPNNIRPTQVFVGANSLEFVYRARGSSAVYRVRSGGNEGRLVPRLESSSFPARVSRELQRRLAQRLDALSVGEQGALLGRCALVAALEGEPTTPSEALLGPVLRALGSDEPSFSELHGHFLARAEDEGLDFAPLLLFAALRDGDVLAALKLWDEFGARIEAEARALHRYCTIVMFFFLGRTEEARTLLAAQPVEEVLFETRGLADLCRVLGLERRGLELRMREAFSSGQLGSFELAKLAEAANECTEHDLAVRLAEDAVKASDYSHELLVTLVDVWVHAGRVDLALEHLERALAEEERPRLLAKALRIRLAMGDCVRARALARSLATEPDFELDARLAAAICDVLEGHAERAVEALSAVLEEDPAHLQANLWIVQARFLLGEHAANHQHQNSRFFKDVTGEHPVAKLLAGMDQHLVSKWADFRVFFKHRQLIRTLRADHPPFESLSPAEEVELIWSVVRQFGGWLEEPLTLQDPSLGGLKSARSIGSARSATVEIQHRVLYEPVDDVRSQLAARAERFPDVPYHATYRAELALWRGDYEDALSEFEDTWQRMRQRWSYVGSGAALLMLGRYEEALRRFDEGLQHFAGYIVGEASPGYLGEAYMQLGDLEKAREELERAIELRPLRLGSRVALAILDVREGRAEDAETMLEPVAERCPQLLWEAHRALGLEARVMPRRSDLPVVLEHALESLRGNRSTHILTFYAADGSWRRLLIKMRPERLRRRPRCLLDGNCASIENGPPRTENHRRAPDGSFAGFRSPGVASSDCGPRAAGDPASLRRGPSVLPATSVAPARDGMPAPGRVDESLVHQQRRRAARPRRGKKQSQTQPPPLVHRARAPALPRCAYSLCLDSEAWPQKLSVQACWSTHHRNLWSPPVS
jgi:tetratricopeptide (TPR) repeat protein